MSETARHRIIVIVILSVILGAGIGFAVSYAVFKNTISETYLNSQPLRNYPQEILPSSSVGGWVLNWTPTTTIRITGVQVLMGNPVNVEWRGDTYVTIGGEPSDPSISSSYNDTVQLLVHYQFDGHASTSMPSQVMWDFTPGFKATPGQTIYVYRDFVNTEPYNVTAGDVQVIIYYENA